MELAAAGRPFIYFPLAGHFEQRRHVAHRLDRYGAGRRMEFDSVTDDELATAIVQELGRPAAPIALAPDAAARAAGQIAAVIGIPAALQHSV
jgi:UDP:flavonoid glycosyltransferase YjiC (YdhE family)